MANRGLLAILPCLVVSGCATMFSPGPDYVPVSTRPPGARVLLDGYQVGVSPVMVAVPRGSEGIFTFELAGYESRTIDRDKVVNGATFVNLGWILVWPAVPIGFGIDALSGNLGKYSTTPLNVELVPLVTSVEK